MDGDTLREIRSAYGLSRNELAELLGFSWLTIEAWEQGVRCIPSIDWKLLRCEGYLHFE
jgi:DNA-binding transcriptional regulator YiaG